MTGGKKVGDMAIDTSYHLTAHVDLRATQLEDFIEHAMPIIKGLATLGLLDKEGGQWKSEGWNPHPYEKDSSTQVRQWDFVPDGNEPASIIISEMKQGNTLCRWGGTYTTQGFWPGNKRFGQGKSDFRIEATHYRRDRLNVVMWESPNIEPILGNYLLGWLNQYWRDDGVIDLLGKGPEPDPPADKEPMPALPSRAHPEQWDTWFKWYYLQPWGGTHSIEHMAKILPGKSRSRIQKMHANYQAANRAKPTTAILLP